VTRRDIVKTALEGKRPPYVPWSFRFTKEAREALGNHYAAEDMEAAVGNHILELGSDIGFFEDLGDNLYRDVFGAVWDRSIDKDIGNIRGLVLPGPAVRDDQFPDPLDPASSGTSRQRYGHFPTASGSSASGSRSLSAPGRCAAWRT